METTQKRILIIGASPNPMRYSYKATLMLKRYGYEIVAVGLKNGFISDIPILEMNEISQLSDIHTITLYINPALQFHYYEIILNLKPQRLIFNPGTENDEFCDLAEKHNIEIIENCTMMMLKHGCF